MQPKTQAPITNPLQSKDAIPITPSDTVDIVNQASGNDKKYRWVFLECVDASGPVRVETVEGTIITTYLVQGMPKSLAVKKVFATNPLPPGTLIGHI
jgi:hypothetical protein